GGRCPDGRRRLATARARRRERAEQHRDGERKTPHPHHRRHPTHRREIDMHRSAGSSGMVGPWPRQLVWVRRSRGTQTGVSSQAAKRSAAKRSYSKPSPHMPSDVSPELSFFDRFATKAAVFVSRAWFFAACL